MLKQTSKPHYMAKKFLPITIAMFAVIITAATIDLKSLYNYESQPKPDYITRDNTPGSNPITDKGATLGRVLFYDKNLSLNNTIACASCHKQEFAFSDTAALSSGITGGKTGRHSMRLVNARFSQEPKFFWDERAASLENQTTKPIQDHVEMGFSGTNGQPGLDSLIRKMEKIDYYKTLFHFVYGSEEITENKIQRALAQFIRSIQSFDSKYDIGRAQVAGDGAPFPNFTQQENQGKNLFLQPPPQGGAGCAGCHNPPEFSIDPNSLNNGVIGVAGSGTLLDLSNTRSPSLRDLVNPTGALNGPLMHNGEFTSLAQVIEHYNFLPPNPGNTNLDPRLQGPNAQGQNLNLTQAQKSALEAFLRTLTGSNMYIDEKWSNPFDSNGNIIVIPADASIARVRKSDLMVFPNPANDFVNFQLPKGAYQLSIFDSKGQLLLKMPVNSRQDISISPYPSGTLFFTFTHLETGETFSKKVIKL
jgi:cytochrome c peroxidase